jgi:hypothetical protein
VRSTLVLVIFLAACGARIGGDDSVDDLRPDASLARQPDAAMQQQQPDAATPVVMDNACGVAQTQGDLGTLTGFAGTQLQEGSTTNRIRWVGSETAATASQATPDIVMIELWDTYGAFNGAAARTGTFTLTGADLDYDTCGICVLMLANVANNTPSKTMLATSGTVTITSVGTTAGQMTQAKLTNASFVEIAVVNNDTVSVAGSNCTSPISNVELRGTL